jgi:hypothetical protein
MNGLGAARQTLRWRPNKAVQRRRCAVCHIAADRYVVFRASDEPAFRRALRELGLHAPSKMSSTRLWRHRVRRVARGHPVKSGGGISSAEAHQGCHSSR